MPCPIPRDRWRAGSVLSALLFASTAVAELPPIAVSGYLEYQARNIAGERFENSFQNLATWKTKATTYVWQPWILQLDGGLGITKTNTSRETTNQDGHLFTGDLYFRLFPQSRFPFTAFYENRDSRVDGDLSGLDLTTQAFGISQQYAPTGGGRYAIDFRHTDNDEVRSDELRSPNGHTSNIWQLNLARAFGQHVFDLNSNLRDIQRDDDRRGNEERMSHTLRHRFRTGPRFFLEDTVFLSDESLELDGTESQRRYFQVHGITNWRPDTRRPLLLTGTALLQATESEISQNQQETENIVLTGGLTYQWTPHFTLAANVGATTASADGNEDVTTVFERIRATYLAPDRFFGENRYSWSGTLEAGNRNNDGTGPDTLQELIAGFGHNLSRNFEVGGGQLQFNIGQQATAAEDTENKTLQTLTHSAFITWNRQAGTASSFIRLSATDRRRFDDEDDEFQLINLQVSRTIRKSRMSSWNGSLTIQYIRTRQEPLLEDVSENKTISYSANIGFVHRELFRVRGLSFTSDLRLLSNDFRSENPLDDVRSGERDREDAVWRNRLDYRVGRLQLSLHANLAEVDGDMNNLVFFQIRRSYGAI